MGLLERDDVFLEEGPSLSVVLGRAEDGFVLDDRESSPPASVVLDLRVRAQHGSEIGA